MNSKHPVSQSLLAWQAVWLYSKMPSCCAPQSTPETITSRHSVKMTAMMQSRSSVDSFADDMDKASVSEML
ncbi:unnamed protein product [Mesocestoides corti]|uniref:Uncharacterized protein n=1 Tax=Mesocestoides corti TaxID=53468 RepID=A0A0R3UN83_MESCO|nr:unnamed protein product [Mesocestoides corti]